MRIIIALSFALSITACGGQSDLQIIPKDMPVIPSFPENVRYWQNEFSDMWVSLQENNNFLDCGEEPKNGIKLLALNADYLDLPFAAGLMDGWKESKEGRPVFDIITGVSGGALIAPLVFAFPSSSKDNDKLEMFFGFSAEKKLITKRKNEYDDLSARKYKDEKRKKLMEYAKSNIPMAFYRDSATPNPSIVVLSSLSLLFLDSYYLTGSVQDVITGMVNDDLLIRIAKEHRCGRRLFVGTTNLTHSKGVFWDLGALAARFSQLSSHIDAINWLEKKRLIEKKGHTPFRIEFFRIYKNLAEMLIAETDSLNTIKKAKVLLEAIERKLTTLRETNTAASQLTYYREKRGGWQKKIDFTLGLLERDKQEMDKILPKTPEKSKEELKKLFRDVLMASVSVPFDFPPVMFKSRYFKKDIEEIHVYGNVSSNVFLFPNLNDKNKNIITNKIAERLDNETAKHRVFLMNDGNQSSLGVSSRTGLGSVANRSLAISEIARIEQDIDSIRVWAREIDAEYCHVFFQTTPVSTRTPLNDYMHSSREMYLAGHGFGEKYTEKEMEKFCKYYFPSKESR